MPLLGEEALIIPLQKLSTGKSLSGFACYLSCWLTKVYCLWHCPQSHLNHGNSGSKLGYPSGAVLTKPLA